MIISANIKDEIYVANWEHTKWLVLSSFFFMVPAIYAFINNLYSYFIILFLTSLISANYWRKATYSWRRDLDLIFAKVSFIIFFANGIFYVRTMHHVIPGYTGVIVLIYFYYLSSRLHKLKINNWYKCHFVFHFIMTCEQIIIIDSILKNKNFTSYIHICNACGPSFVRKF